MGHQGFESGSAACTISPVQILQLFEKIKLGETKIILFLFL